MTIDRDKEHLRLLSIFHYIVGGMIALGSCIFIIHVIMGLFMGTAMILAPDKNGPPAAFGFFIALIPLMLILAGWTIAACIIYAGRCIAKFKKHTFCFVMAVVMCIFMPMGTILGVFTIVVLMRPEVKKTVSTCFR